MSDDFGTINVSRAERAREIEVMREHYRHHRAALEGLIADAPTEHLAQQYGRLVADIDTSLSKLDQLDGPPSPQRKSTEPGMRPLVTPPQDGYTTAPDRKPGVSASRVVLILLAGVVGLALIGWLIWRASDRGNRATGVVAEETTATAPVDTETVETLATGSDAAVAGLAATPASQDFGIVRKGTRAVRTFTLRNESDSPLSIKVSRSVCRCLYYQHPPVIPPKNQETLTVTIDGAKARAGDLRETLQITSGDPSVKTSVDIIATVR